ncbi:MAG: hypothetical protein C1943_12610 [Halochromatium sp.]|nr:hypothetical protein [Halochromatium sp.]
MLLVTSSRLAGAIALPVDLMPWPHTHLSLPPTFWLAKTCCSRSGCRFMLLFVLSMLMLGSAEADEDDVALARRLRAQGHILPLEQLLTRAQELKSGIPVEVELHAEDDPPRYRYEIEMLDGEGALWSIAFDAKTGQLIHLHSDED